MLDFHKITLNDGPWMREILKKTHHMSCEYCFGNHYAWQKTYDARVCRVNAYYIVGLRNDEGEDGISFLYPAGTGDIRPVIEALLKHCHEVGIRFRMHSMEEADKAELLRLFPGKFEITEHRDYADYVYRVSDLINLAGKKYHGKRNHLARFYENNWSFEPITADNVAECLEMNQRWSLENADTKEDGVLAERCAVRLCLTHMEELGCFGGLLRVNGEVAAYTVGERLSSDTVVVHFEKAFSRIQGAYPAINREFLSRMCGDYTYVNREEDLGIEGLRRAKESYHPAFLVTKYGVTLVK